MKAKKSLIITLFAAVMIFAFGATAAFAAYTANSGTWNKDYTAVTVNSDGVHDETYTDIDKVWSDGLVVATLDVASHNPPLPYSESAEYYDLNNSTLKCAGTWSRAAFDAAYNKDKATLGSGITFMLKDAISKTAQPDKDFTATKYAGDYEVTYNVSDYDPDNKAAQTVTVSVNIKAKGTGDAATKQIDRLVYKELPTATINVQAKPVKWTDMQLEFDKIKSTSATVSTGMEIKAKYDGETHTIVNSEVEGWTAAWAVQNEKTGAYEAVNAVEIKDAGSVNFRLELTPSATTEKKQTIYGKATIDPAAPLYLEFKALKWDTANSAYLVFTGADPWDYVEATDVADSDAVEALAFFKEKYTIEVKEAANNASAKQWIIKDNKDFDKTAAAKTYEVLLKNYSMVADGAYTYYDTRTVLESADPALDPNTKSDDVTITFAPNKVTYKAKKLKKKAASFTVEAVAASGKEVSFIMTSPNKKISIDSATGTVTVAKKMKKGTYKVKIKAMTTSGAGYAAATDVANVTIKIKK